MHAWESIQKTLDYIEAHICEEMQIEALAELAALSLFYYQRLFTKLVRVPVREYIKLRRLARAGAALGQGRKRVLEIALEYGFGSHEVFTRAFKETYGVTPAQYRKNPEYLRNFDKPDLMLNYVVMDEGAPLISNGLVLEMNRRTLEAPVDFVGVAGYIPFKSGKMLGERPGIDTCDRLWRHFYSIQREVPCIPGGRHMGVCYHGGAPEGYASYFAGAEVAPDSPKPPFTLWRLPAREYVVCGFEADSPVQLADSAIPKAMKYTRLWLRERGLIADGFFPEMYYPGRREQSAAFMELWVPFRQREAIK